MNGWFITFLIVLALACVAFAVSIPAKRAASKASPNSYEADDARILANIARVSSWSLFGITGLLMIFSTITIIPANEVGVVTNFGSWSGTMTSGLGVTAPWSEVDTFGTRNQKSVRDQAEGNGTCVNVKMDGGSTGCQDLTVLYTIDEVNAEKLWRGWKDFSKLNGDLIERQTDDSVLAIFPLYKPLDAQGSKRGEISDKVTAELRKRLEPQGVNLESITLGTLNLPEQTQDNLNKLANADTSLQIALKGEAQAMAENAANVARQQSLTPEALIVLCLNTAKEVRPQIMPECGLGVSSGRTTLVQIK